MYDKFFKYDGTLPPRGNKSYMCRKQWFGTDDSNSASKCQSEHLQLKNVIKLLYKS